MRPRSSSGFSRQLLLALRRHRCFGQCPLRAKSGRSGIPTAASSLGSFRQITSLPLGSPVQFRTVVRTLNPTTIGVGPYLERGELCSRRLRLWIALKHRRQRDVQGLADIEKAPRADTVLPAFVFLNLLERDAQGLAEVCLAYAERLPAHAHPIADEFVDRIWASWGG